jgi:sugar lactone lactonase YvrE
LGNGGAYPVYVGIGVVFRIDASGMVTTVPGSGSTIDGGVGGGLGANYVAVGPSGDIYVAETPNCRIQVIHP